MTCHMKSNTNGMYGLEKCKDIKIDTANGSTSIFRHIGNYKGKVQCADGSENVIIMKKVKVVPGLVKIYFVIYSNAQRLGLSDGNNRRQ